MALLKDLDPTKDPNYPRPAAKPNPPSQPRGQLCPSECPWKTYSL